jgi:hypothetical protein
MVFANFLIFLRPTARIARKRTVATRALDCCGELALSSTEKFLVFACPRASLLFHPLGNHWDGSVENALELATTINDKDACLPYLLC